MDIELKELRRYKQQAAEHRQQAEQLFEAAMKLYGGYNDGVFEYPVSMNTNCERRLYGLNKQDFIACYIYAKAYSKGQEE